MLTPSVIIFSHRDDEHLGPVLRRMDSKFEPLVFDIRSLGNGLVGSLLLGDSLAGPALRLPSGEAVSLENISAVWWRRPTRIEVWEGCEPRYRQFVATETQFFLEGLIECLPADVAFYNHPDFHARLDRKVLQLRLARSNGLRVPDTCVTSDPIVAEEFLNRWPKAIYKSFWGNEEFWQPTRLIGDEIIQAISDARLCPVVFQEYIDGVRDYRITVIDDELASVAFDIKGSRYPYDVRIDTRIECEIRELPRGIEDAVRRFCAAAGLRYAAIDLRETPDGEFVFFEVNPAGQFLYLDKLAGTNIAATMAQALSKRRSVATNIHECGLRAVHSDLAGPVTVPISRPLHAAGKHIAHLVD